MRVQQGGEHAGRFMPVLLWLHELRNLAETAEGGLLCFLFIRYRKMSSGTMLLIAGIW